MKLLETTFVCAGATLSSIIPFERKLNQSDKQNFSSPWDTFLYKQYCSSVSFGNVGLVDLFADGCTLALFGTESWNFVRVSFSNITGFYEMWFQIGIATTQKQFPEYIPNARRQCLRALLYHCFLFMMTKELVKDSYNGFIVKGIIIAPRVGMVIADQPEERLFFRLNGNESFMDCTLCTLP